MNVLMLQIQTDKQITECSVLKHNKADQACTEWICCFCQLQLKLLLCEIFFWDVRTRIPRCPPPRSCHGVVPRKHPFVGAKS